MPDLTGGHIVKTPGTPPAVLFHGTATASLPVILADGLRPMRRQYVHLSADRDTALSVGSRKSADVTPEPRAKHRGNSAVVRC